MLLSLLSWHEHSPAEEKCVTNYYILNNFKRRNEMPIAVDTSP